MNFLTAEWRKLAMINYIVDPELLKPYLPFGTTLDLWQGQCYLSLVGFLFLNTRLLGISVPRHKHFEEVNLRFYVLRDDGQTVKRGVVFIKEIVPKTMLSFVANTIYREHYETMKMNHSILQNAAETQVTYAWGNELPNHIKLTATAELTDINPDAEAAFITEHYWGYTRVNAQKTLEYEVAHPTWQQYQVKDYSIKVHFGHTYGPQFAFLQDTQPVSVLLAEGSEIMVKNTKRII